MFFKSEQTKRLENEVSKILALTIQGKLTWIYRSNENEYQTTYNGNMIAALGSGWGEDTWYSLLLYSETYNTKTNWCSLRGVGKIFKLLQKRRIMSNNEVAINRLCGGQS